MNPDDAVKIVYLDVDNERIYEDQGEYREVLRDRKDKAVERCIILDDGTSLVAAGILSDSFGSRFTAMTAVLIYTKILKEQDNATKSA